MSIVINKELCKNCGKCANVCPGSLIKRDEDGQIFMKYPKDCWGCSSCIKECAFDAISLYLGADIGGGKVRCRWRTKEICFCGISARWMAPQTR